MNPERWDLEALRAGGMVALAAGATAPVPKRLGLFLAREPPAIVAVLVSLN